MAAMIAAESSAFKSRFLRPGQVMSDTDPKVFQQILSQYGGPAFVRRGREVQLAFDAQVEACRGKREKWLEWVRLPLGTLFALAGSAAALEEFLDNSNQLQGLKKLMDDLQPQLRLPPAASTSRGVLRRAFAEVRGAIERFNERWHTFIAELDLQEVNEIRDRYNRFYLLEEECALGSGRLARHGFQRLNPLRPEDFLNIFPLLPMP
jgi:hypothetical protein